MEGESFTLSLSQEAGDSLNSGGKCYMEKNIKNDYKNKNWNHGKRPFLPVFGSYSPLTGTTSIDGLTEITPWAA